MVDARVEQSLLVAASPQKALLQSAKHTDCAGCRNSVHETLAAGTTDRSELDK